MYVPSEYSDYKYIVSYSDNYVVLTDRGSVNASFDNPTSIDVLVKYIYPSPLSIPSSQTFRSSQTFEQIEITTDDFDRGDYPSVLLSFFFAVGFICIIINCLTKLFVRGGIFFED